MTQLSCPRTEETIEDTLILSEPPLEVAESLIPFVDFFAAQSLLCLNNFWAKMAAHEHTWRLLCVRAAIDAKLHYHPPALDETPEGGLRAECRRLYELRGTFSSTFCGRTAPLPMPVPFSVQVGVRFRPPGLANESVREVCLPIHQRLKLIQQATGCTPAEARRRLWGGSHDSIMPDHFQSCCAVPVPAPQPPAQQPPDAIEEKENDCAQTERAHEDVATKGEEAAEEEKSGIKLTTEAGLVAMHGGRAIVCAPGAGIRAFTFAHSWDAQSAQPEVFGAISPLINDVLNGRSACVLAYGQTGSGKTFTMFGGGSSIHENMAQSHDTGLPVPGQTAGVAPRAVSEVMGALASRAALGVRATLKLAAVEIFGDSVTDLLHEGAEIGAWQGVAAAAAAAGHADVEVESISHAIDLIDQAERAKRRAATAMNERSSRAHSLLMLTLEQRAAEGESVVKSQLCLADLGGCEKVKRSGVVGERLQEAILINKGLLALKSVVSALMQGRGYVPYQDDKLTMLLKPSLSGGAQTLVMLAARPEAEHAVETLQALRFGEACSQIEVGTCGGPDRAAALALAALDAQISEIEALILKKERFETYTERRVDPRAGLADAAGGAAYLTDVKTYEVKVSRIVGAEKEHAMLDKVLAARRELLGE